MTRPLCPNCRERMSSVEAGLCGVWSCLYCEGVWLPPAEVEALADMRGTNLKAVPWPTQGDTSLNLRCPSCEGMSFAALPVAAQQVPCCTACHGLFIPKASAKALSLYLATEPWLSRASLPDLRSPTSQETLAAVIVAELVFRVLS